MGLITALAVVLSTGPAAAKPVLLQSAESASPDAYTTSPTKAPPPATASADPSAASSAGTTTSGTKVVSGATQGLYGGTENVSSCDLNQLSDFLTTHPDKGAAWAGVEGIAQSDIPAYLHSLTPVVLRADTRVTNHGFANGQATTFQSVLQAGTAVLVDSHGVPRTRCACGNPLLPPAARSSESFTGTAWSTFQPKNVVVVEPAPVQITVIVLFDPQSGQYFARPAGGTGHDDHKAPPPSSPASPPSTASSGSTSPSTSPSTPCASGSASAATSSGGQTPCPPTSSPSAPLTPLAPTSSSPSLPPSSGSTGSSPSTPTSPTPPSTSPPAGGQTPASPGTGPTSGTP